MGKQVFKTKRGSTLNNSQSNISFKSPQPCKTNEIPNKINAPVSKHLSMRRLTMESCQQSWMCEKPGISSLKGVSKVDPNAKPAKCVKNTYNSCNSLKASFQKNPRISEITNNISNNSVSMRLKMNITPKITGFDS